MTDLESIMDEKTHLACACSQLNEAIHALEQATFNMISDYTIEERKRVWDMIDNLTEMVNTIIEAQKDLRDKFNERKQED